MADLADHLPPDAEAVLEHWRPRVVAILGDSLRGARLFGSAALGGFEPNWSDIDVCVLLSEPVTDEQVRELGALHREIEDRFLGDPDGPWRSTQGLEGCYVPESLASEPGAQARCLLVGTGQCEVEVCDPVPGLERVMLAERSLPILGDPASFVLDDPAATRRHLAWLPRHLEAPAEAHSPIMLAGLLQELARTIAYLRDGRLLSKTAALMEEIDAGSELAEGYDLALRIRRLGSARAGEHRGELESAYRTVAEPARRWLSERTG